MPLEGAGILPLHEDAISLTAQHEDVFLFIRPTNSDSTVLIGEGFPTKSMDIHHKSSNWGPMAGFVPVDIAFDKQLGDSPQSPGIKAPDANVPTEVRRDETHNAETMQLYLTETLLNSLSGERGKIAPIEVKGVWTGPDSRNILSTKRVAISNSTSAPATAIRWYRATATHLNAERVKFCLTKKEGLWQVWWVVNQRDFTGYSEMKLCPLYVWAYRVEGQPKPVTGDYDLWMVAPSHAHVRDHWRSTLNPDSHGGHWGGSAATAFVTGIVSRLNAACGRTRNPVFRHGAEAQNYAFTQALDPQLALFTPGGSRKMIPMSNVPRALYEIRMRGYLVYWNKRYRELDPFLMEAKSTEEALRRIEHLRHSLKNFVLAKARWKQYRADKQLTRPEAEENVSGKQIARNYIASSVHLLQQMNRAQADARLLQIRKFDEELREWMRLRDKKLLVLQSADFKNDAMLSNKDRLIQTYLEESMVEATRSQLRDHSGNLLGHEQGAGETDEAQLDTLLTGLSTALE